LKDGLCVKCGSNEVYFDPVAGDLVTIGNTNAALNVIPVKRGFFSSSVAVLDNYVCGRCGYVESYILDNRKLQEIVQNWTRAARE
jgi:predicted nucleic-acid-binding Zn-ribbon protein